MFPQPIERRGPRAVAAYRVLIAVSLAIWLLPLLAVALTSVRPIEDLHEGNLWGWPRSVLFDNYAEVLQGSRMPRFIANSVLVAVPSVAAALLLSTMAGYALARQRVPGANALLFLFVAGNLVPFQSLMIPVRDLAVALGLYDSRWMLVLFHSAFQTGFCTLFMRNFIRELPESMLEAARLDGASEFRILWQVVVPAVRPALAALGVLVFTFVWNDYFWSLVLVQSDDVRPLTAGLQSVRGMWQTSWQLLCAGSLIAAAPPVALFFVMQRHLIHGLTYRIKVAD